MDEALKKEIEAIKSEKDLENLLINARESFQKGSPIFSTEWFKFLFDKLKEIDPNNSFFTK